jgi:hypothetical protein
MASVLTGETSLNRYGSKSSIWIRDYFIRMGKSISMGDESMGRKHFQFREISRGRQTGLRTF